MRPSCSVSPPASLIRSLVNRSSTARRCSTRRSPSTAIRRPSSDCASWIGTSRREGGTAWSRSGLCRRNRMEGTFCARIYAAFERLSSEQASKRQCPRPPPLLLVPSCQLLHHVRMASPTRHEQRSLPVASSSPGLASGGGGREGREQSAGGSESVASSQLMRS